MIARKRKQGTKATKIMSVSIGTDNHPMNQRATPALIIAPVRSGGTFLEHCLSNHPDIFCERGEPLLVRSVWRPYTLKNRTRLLDVLLNQTGYRVSMCKLTYDQVFCEDVWAWVMKRNPKVIWLTRESLLRQAISMAINRMVNDDKLQRAQHSFESVPVEPVTIDPAQIIRFIKHFGRQNAMAKVQLKQIKDVLPVTYEEITRNPKQLYQAEGLNPDAGKRICEFLGVPFEPMPTHLVRVNPGPLCSILSNWVEVRDMLVKTFPEIEKGEQHWDS